VTLQWSEPGQTPNSVLEITSLLRGHSHAWRQCGLATPRGGFWDMVARSCGYCTPPYSTQGIPPSRMICHKCLG
jgi:hypothetical protein